MKKLSIIVGLLLFVTSVHAQNNTIIGDWQGHIKLQGEMLNIKTHFKKNNSLRGTIDIPQQGAEGIPLQNIAVQKQDSVFFEFQAGPGLAKFKGTFRGDSTIIGNFDQHDQQFPFKLDRYEPKSDTTQPRRYSR